MSFRARNCGVVVICVFPPSAFTCVYLAPLSYFEGRGTEAQRGEEDCPRPHRTGTRAQIPDPRVHTHGYTQDVTK